MLRAIQQRERAELAEEMMEREMNRATEVKGLIAGMLSGINPQVARGQDKALLAGILDEAASRLLRGEIDDELIAAELHYVIGTAYRSIGEWDEADHHLPLALEIRTRRLGNDDPATLQTMHETLALSMFLGNRDPERSERLPLMAAEILELRKRVLGPEHPDTLTSVETLATIYGTFGRRDEIEPILTRNLEARTRVLGAENRDTLESMAHLALLHCKQGRLAEAEPLLEEVLATRTRVLGEDHPDTLVSVSNLFMLYEMQGRLDDSLPLRRRSVLIAERVLGKEHLYTLDLRSGLGSLYDILGRPGDAALVYEDDVRERRRIDGMRKGTTWTAMRHLAASYDMIGRRSDALALYRELLRPLRRGRSEERAGPLALFTVAWVLTRDHPEVHDPARAIDFAQRAVDKAEARGRRDVHLFLDTLALALHQTGASAEAIETERRAIARIPEMEPRETDARTDEIVRASYEARLRMYEASMAGQAPRPTEDPSP